MKGYKIAAGIALLMVASCTSTGPVVPVSVISTPPGADVDLNGAYVGTTPTELAIPCSRHWVGVLNSADGWAYDSRPISVTVYPTENSQGDAQTKTIDPCQAGGAALTLKFDLRLRHVTPVQRFEVR
jgi:hypothetical protein